MKKSKKFDILYIPGLAGRGRPIDQEVPLPASKYNRYFFNYPQDPKYQLKDYTKAILEFITEKNMDKPLMIATSFGGLLAIRFASQYGDKISGLVMMASNTKYRLNGKLQVLVNFYKILPLVSPLQRLTRPVYYVTRDFISKLHGLGNDVSEHWMSISWKVYKTRIDIVRNERFDDDYGKIDIPVLFVYEEGDPILPFEYIKETADKLKDAQFKGFKGKTHFPHIDYPKEVGVVLEEFINTKCR